MGLDISYYSKLTPLKCAFDSDGEPLNEDGTEMDYDTYHKPYQNPDFPARFEGLEEGVVYGYEESGSFRAGSYGGYNIWRESLAELAGYPKTETKSHGQVQQSYAAGCWAASSGPFWELIMFSDCEGDMGTPVCLKLAKDFAAFDAHAQNHSDDLFYERYRYWRTAFEKAADGGCVSFH